MRWRALHGPHRGRAHPLQHGRLVRDRKRPADPRARSHRVTSRWRTTATSPTPSSCAGTRGRWRDLPSHDGLRSHRASHRTSAWHRRRKNGLHDALSGVEGAYCLLVVIDETVVVARDPHGWRPLVMGRLGDGWVFASESCALDIVGATHEREVAAWRDCRDRSPWHPQRAGHCHPHELNRCVFEHVYFARPDSKVFRGSVDRSRRELGRQLARECPAPGRRPGLLRTRLVELGRAWIRRGVAAAIRVRAHPESLRRPHVHSAHAGRS